MVSLYQIPLKRPVSILFREFFWLEFSKACFGRFLRIRFTVLSQKLNNLLKVVV